MKKRKYLELFKHLIEITRASAGESATPTDQGDNPEMWRLDTSLVDEDFLELFASPFDYLIDSAIGILQDAVVSFDQFFDAMEDVRSVAATETGPTAAAFINRQSKRELERLSHQKEMAECTFRPKINTVPNSSRIGKQNLMARIAAHEEKKKEHIAELRKQKEDEEMRDCTFRPKLVSKYKGSSTIYSSPYAARGIVGDTDDASEEGKGGERGSEQRAGGQGGVEDKIKF